MVPHPPGSPHFPYTTLFRSYGRAVRLAMAYADTVNQAFDAAKPWVMAKGISTADDATREQLQDICSRALAGFKALTVMLRSEEHTSELQSRENLVCRLLPEQ